MSLHFSLSLFHIFNLIVFKLIFITLKVLKNKRSYAVLLSSNNNRINKPTFILQLFSKYMRTFLCVVCNSEVLPRQHEIQCNLCSRWQHRFMTRVNIFALLQANTVHYKIIQRVFWGFILFLF